MNLVERFARHAAATLLRLSGAIRVHIRVEYEHGGVNFVAPEADWKEVARVQANAK